MLWAKHTIDSFEGVFRRVRRSFSRKAKRNAKFFWPLHNAPVFVNLRGASVDFTQKERDALPKDDLGLN